jgi:hypothetical protein
VGLNEAKMNNAHAALAVYLQKIRLERKELWNYPAEAEVPTEFAQCSELVAVVLDTSLLRALLKVGWKKTVLICHLFVICFQIDHPHLLELVSGKNACHVPACESLLMGARKFKELVAL